MCPICLFAHTPHRFRSFFCFFPLFYSPFYAMLLFFCPSACPSLALYMWSPEKKKSINIRKIIWMNGKTAGEEIDRTHYLFSAIFSWVLTAFFFAHPLKKMAPQKHMYLDRDHDVFFTILRISDSNRFLRAKLRGMSSECYIIAR